MAIHRFYENYPDCNRCEPSIKCAGRINPVGCRSYAPPNDRWMLDVPHRRGDEPEILKLVEYSINFDEKLDTYGLFSTSS